MQPHAGRPAMPASTLRPLAALLAAALAVSTLACGPGAPGGSPAAAPAGAAAAAPSTERFQYIFLRSARQLVRVDSVTGQLWFVPHTGDGGWTSVGSTPPPAGTESRPGRYQVYSLEMGRRGAAEGRPRLLRVDGETGRAWTMELVEGAVWMGIDEPDGRVLAPDEPAAAPAPGGDAAPGGGKLTIETGNAYLDQDYADRHVDVTAGQYVVLTVSDTGAGMTAEVVERAFEPFFSTKGEGKGSGLGLSMVYGFVKQSGGHIKIYAEPGLGTAIKLYFPRARQGATPAAIETERGTVVGGGEHVLVVEDEPLVRAHVESLLLGYRVTTAANGPAAMAVLERRADIDLLFTDVVMPGGMNGRELAEAAARLRPGLEVLFTSGYTENAIVHHGRLDPGVQLLSKPYRRRDLARRLRLVLDRRDPPAAAGEAAP